MEYHTQVNYSGRQGEILVVMFMDQVNLFIGDTYYHKSLFKEIHKPKSCNGMQQGVAENGHPFKQAQAREAAP